MKAISIKQPYASLISLDNKRIETRSWPTKYRGDLLIVSSKQPDVAAMEHFGFEKKNLLFGQALCIAELVDCRPMTKDDEKAARCSLYDGAWAWVLDNIRPIEPFPVKGQLGLYEVDYEVV